MDNQISIKEAQKLVDDWIHKYGVRYFSELTNMACLTEEVGELVVTPGVVAVVPTQCRRQLLVRGVEGTQSGIIVVEGVAGDVLLGQRLRHHDGLLAVLGGNLTARLVHRRRTPHGPHVEVLVRRGSDRGGDDPRQRGRNHRDDEDQRRDERAALRG